jgi:hypothetical protein
MEQCFICGEDKNGQTIQGFHCCSDCEARGGRLVITSEYGEGMGVMEAAYLEILCTTPSQ